MSKAETTVPKLLFSAEEAAQALGICQKTLWSSTKPRGDVPCVRIGTRVLYDPADLRTWIVGRKEGPSE